LALKSFLDATFKIKGLGEAHYFLGMAILSTKEGLVLTQRKFTTEILKKFLDDNATLVICPLDCNQKLSID